MPKRTFWLVSGAAIGAGSSLWAERKVRRSLQEAAARLQPDAIVVEVGRSARQVAGTAGSRVRDAVSTGRDEMQRREQELWADLADRGVDAPVAPSPAAGPSAAQPPVGPVAGSVPGVRGMRRTRRGRVKSPSYLDK